MSYQYVKGAISCSNSTSYTGSFIKLQALGAPGSEYVIERIEFGELTEPESGFSPSGLSTRIVIPVGSSIEGPIARFKTSGSFSDDTDGGLLAYYSK